MQLSDGIRLKVNNLIKDNDVNIWYICKNLGIPCSTLITFFNGKTSLIKIDTLLHVCEAFNITLSDFFADEIFKDIESD
jgi:DNA-binding Xre family transcriptional regulator